jgi:branched-chain amino acid transport system ATP-binding protein
VASRRSAASTSTSRGARSRRWSGPTARARRRCSTCSPGLLTPTSGRITLEGRDITGQQPEQIAHLGVARSFQITSLFDQLTALEHLELALASPTGLGRRFWQSERRLATFHGRAHELLDQVGMAHLAHRPAGQFAYGQKRALALALALDPKLLLLDEPTAGMGLEDVDRTIELVRRIATGRTVVLVDHNMHVVGSLADRVTVLQQGESLAEGTFDEVRTNPYVVTAYLGQPHA